MDNEGKWKGATWGQGRMVFLVFNHNKSCKNKFHYFPELLKTVLLSLPFLQNMKCFLTYCLCHNGTGTQKFPLQDWLLDLIYPSSKKVLSIICSFPNKQKNLWTTKPIQVLLITTIMFHILPLGTVFTFQGKDDICSLIQPQVKDSIIVLRPDIINLIQ